MNNYVILHKKDDTYIIHNDKEKRVFKTKQEALNAVTPMMGNNDYVGVIEEEALNNDEGTPGDMIIGYSLFSSFMQEINQKQKEKMFNISELKEI